MFAGEATHRFKTLVISWLEQSGFGYDTRYRYYHAQFPELDGARLARLVCDPIEYYDKDWPQQKALGGVPEIAVLTRFVRERDDHFRNEARAAIYCFDEAGIGSGINVMRFLNSGKPVLGFYAADPAQRRINLTNVFQLQLEFPGEVHLAPYETANDVTRVLEGWLRALSRERCA